MRSCFLKWKEKIKSGELKETLLTSERVQKHSAALLLVSYAIIVLWIVIFKCNVNEALHIQENLEKTLWERFTYRLVPFVDIIYLIRTGTFDLEGLAFFFNIICFLPLGLVLPLFFSKKRSVLLLFAFSLGVEIFQLFSGFGGFDPTDLLLNTIGAFLGCLLYAPIRKRLSDRTLNIILLAFIVPIMSWAIFAVIRTILQFPV